MKTLIPIMLSLFLLFPTEITSETQQAEPTQVRILDTIEIPEPVKLAKFVSLGEFKVTGYCACMKCCNKTDSITATGTKATQGRTIAVDPNMIPYGTKVIFNGNGYISEDCGGAIKENRIDLYFDNHQEALEWGVQYHEIVIFVESEE